MKQHVTCEYSHVTTSYNMRQCVTCEHSHMTTTCHKAVYHLRVQSHDYNMRQHVTCEHNHEAGVTCERSHITTTWGRASLKAVINFQRWLYNCGMYDRLLWETTNSEVTIKWLRNVRLKLALGYPEAWYHMNPESQEKRENLKPRTLISHSMVTWPSVVSCGNWPFIMQSYAHDWKRITALTLPAVSVM